MILPNLPQTTAAVALHYDELDPFYRDVWGQHVHHGYWRTGRESATAAADALSDLVADRLQLAAGHTVVDIGCGYGASARRLAANHAVAVTGVTVSAVQAAHAPVAGGVTIREADWLANDFADASFDRGYAIESSEHMPDKQRFFDEAFRTLRPGGRFVVCVWLARAGAAAWEVRHLLEPICREGRLPGMGDEADYRMFAARAGFVCVTAEDISAQVRRTWTICARRLLARLTTQRRYRRFLFDRQAANRIFVVTLVRLLLAYRTGSMRYCVMVFRKPI